MVQSVGHFSGIGVDVCIDYSEVVGTPLIVNFLGSNLHRWQAFALSL